MEVMNTLTTVLAHIGYQTPAIGEFGVLGGYLLGHGQQIGPDLGRRSNRLGRGRQSSRRCGASG